MNGRKGLVRFFAFLLLAMILLLEVLSLVQTNRLNDRLNYLIEMESNRKSFEWKKVE
jgi:hypothetical protein